MRRSIRIGALIAVLTLLVSSAAVALDARETIRVYRNLLTFKVNGQVTPMDNFVLDDEPYIPLSKAAEALGFEYTWDERARVASAVSTPPGARSTAWQSEVDPYNPTFDLRSLGLTASQVHAVAVETDGMLVPVRFGLDGDQLRFAGEIAGLPVLELSTPYVLKVYTRNGTCFRVQFSTAGLPDLSSNGQRRVILVPPMPEKGFYWPYYLAIPSDGYRAQNEGHRRYLIVDTANPGTTTRDVAKFLSDTRATVENQWQVSIQLAERLWTPFIMPAIPRPQVWYDYNGEGNWFYTHALDRDSAMLSTLMKDPGVATDLRQAFQKEGFNVEDFLNLDKQIIAMIDHAIAYLNEYGYGMESKAFFVGYSASGAFADRLSTLHPDKFKAVAAGSAADGMVLPLAEYGGENLVFPIGVSDYRAITGRDFNLQSYNRVARLIFRGEADDNNAVPYSDSFGDNERRIITKLWGLEPLPRAQRLISLYGQAGAKGILILDKGIKHSYSSDMIEYIETFLKANRDSDSPVYPIPANPSQLKYTIYK